MNSVSNSNGSKRERRPSPARLPWQDAGELTSLLLRRYGADEEFGIQLEQVFSDHADIIHALATADAFVWPVVLGAALDGQPPGIREYVDDLRDLALAWGLDRLPNGVQVLHVWCCYRAKMPDFPVESLWTANHAGGEKPVLDDTSAFSLRGHRIRITVEDAWDIDHEPRAEFERRMHQRLTDQLVIQMATVTDTAISAGYQWYDTEPKLERNIDWLFLDLAHCMNSTEIVKREEDDGRPVSKSTVDARLGDMKRRLGITPQSRESR